MKKLSIIIFIIGLVGLFSCKKDETKAVIKSSPGAPVLNMAAGDTVVLKKANADTMITFRWSKSDFGLDLVTTYTLQVDLHGADFKDPITVGTTTNVTTFSILTSDLNNKLLLKEFNPDAPVPLDLDYRVQASVSSYSNPATSATVTNVTTPYFVKIVYPVIFVPGNYQGWNPADSITSIPSVKSNEIYEGYLWMSSSALAYKYTVGPSWTTNYGDNGATGTLVANGDNIAPTTGPGYYHLKADLSKPVKTHSFLKTTWSVIGDGTPGGWNTDTEMAYDSIARTWNVTVNLTAAFIKFRANNDWTLNYGDTGGVGKLVEGGDNIAVPVAGNYTVTLNLSGAIFRYNLKKN